MNETNTLYGIQSDGVFCRFVIILYFHHIHYGNGALASKTGKTQLLDSLIIVFDYMEESGFIHQ